MKATGSHAQDPRAPDRRRAPVDRDAREATGIPSSAAGVAGATLRPAIACVVVALSPLAACGEPGDQVTVPSDDPPDVALDAVATGLAAPVHLTAPPGDDRVFIVEQAGRIRILRDGAVLSTPYLDITDRVASGGERGLLSVAFHPLFAENGRLYVNYTDLAGDTRIVRFEADPDAETVDPGTAELVLAVDQPFPNHNGGLNLFGPDGMLYVGLGDGGSAGDPQGNGQDTSTLLGSILRLDVDGGEPYAIPTDNPFVDGGGDGRAEIWAYGLRNPWRFSFDADAGLLYIADVGQNRLEEINVQAAAAGGLNYGWNVMEGTECFQLLPCDTEGLVLPAREYPHGEGCSATGGVVYRGEDVPSLVGHYVYGDFCGGWIRSFRYEDGEVEDAAEWDVDAVDRLTSFGTDAAGELYVLSAGGTVYRVVAGGGG